MAEKTTIICDRCGTSMTKEEFKATGVHIAPVIDMKTSIGGWVQLCTECGATLIAWLKKESDLL